MLLGVSLLEGQHTPSEHHSRMHAINKRMQRLAKAKEAGGSSALLEAEKEHPTRIRSPFQHDSRMHAITSRMDRLAEKVTPRRLE